MNYCALDDCGLNGNIFVIWYLFYTDSFCCFWVYSVFEPTIFLKWVCDDLGMQFTQCDTRDYSLPLLMPVPTCFCWLTTFWVRVIQNIYFWPSCSFKRHLVVLSHWAPLCSKGYDSIYSQSVQKDRDEWACLSEKQ